VAKIAFLGLGLMGEPMARRLLGASHDLTVWNRSPDKAKGLVEAGAERAATPAEAAAAAEATITMLSTPAVVEEVVFGSQGAAEGLAPGSALIEMSTIGPRALARIAERLPQGVAVVDAPVLGSVPQATDGSLSIFVGGSEEDYARWRDVLGAMGEPRHVGSLGAGAAMKVVVNSTLGAVMTAFGEAMALADALGLEEKAVLDVLEGSPIGATVARKRGHLESDAYPPNFRLALAVKDLNLVEETARAEGLDFKVAAAAKAWYEAAEQAGLGDLDYSAVVAHVRGRPARP
jgi:3-hydroxyisobutyrate dehydrogenase-like beta-hydroxyacid dehydrogenase